MNEAAGDVKRESAEQPEDEQDERQSPQHEQILGDEVRAAFRAPFERNRRASLAHEIGESGGRKSSGCRSGSTYATSPSTTRAKRVSTCGLVFESRMWSTVSPRATSASAMSVR